MLQKKLDRARIARANKPEKHSEPHHPARSIPIFQKNFESKQPAINQKTHIKKRVAEKSPQDDRVTKSTLLSRLFNCQEPQTASQTSRVILEKSIPETLTPSQSRVPDTEMITAFHI